MPELRLLWLTENYYPNRGGMAESCDRIVHSLRCRGVQIDLLHFTGRRTPFREELQQQGTYMAFPIADDTTHSLNLLWNFLQRPAQKKNYTHVVAFGGHLPLLSSPILAQWLGIPLLTLIRGNDFDAAVFSPRKREMLFYALKQSACIAAVSKDKVFKIKQLINNAPVHFTPNGIDLDYWQPLHSDQEKAVEWREQYVPKNHRVVGVFGHLKAKKGMDLLLKAIVRAACQDRLHLLITGELTADIETQLSDNQISYTLEAFKDRYELLSRYPACDIVAIPSHYDGMPNVLLEAGSLAIPFLAAAVDGMNDLLTDGQDAFLFHPGDLQQATTAIRNMMQASDKQLKGMGLAIQKHIKTHYTHQQEAEHYIRILRMILN